MNARQDQPAPLHPSLVDAENEATIRRMGAEISRLRAEKDTRLRGIETRLEKLTAEIREAGRLLGNAWGCPWCGVYYRGGDPRLDLLSHINVHHPPA